MELNELIASYHDNKSSTVLKSILKNLMKEEGLYSIICQDSGNFFLGEEEEKASAYLFTERERAIIFARLLRQAGASCQATAVKVKARETYFVNLYRSGFTAVTIDKGDEINVLTLPLKLLVEPPKDEDDTQTMNPTLIRSANRFYQAIAMKQVTEEMQQDLSTELYNAKFLIPVKSLMDLQHPRIRDNEGNVAYPIFTDWFEFLKFDRKHEMQIQALKFRQLKRLLNQVDKLVLNPGSFGLELDREKIDRINQENKALKVVK